MLFISDPLRLVSDHYGHTQFNGYNDVFNQHHNYEFLKFAIVILKDVVKRIRSKENDS